MDDIKNIIESLLFVAEEPLTVDKLKRILTPAQSEDIRSAIAAISADYEARHGGFYLHEVAGGFQIRTRPEYTEWIKALIQPKPLRLSKAAMETLAIIAYKQPIIRSDIEHIRGVDCGGVLRVLLERKLIRVLGRKEIAGRPLIYATTKRFLEVFDLKDLKDLPTPREIEELGSSILERRAVSPLEGKQDQDASFGLTDELTEETEATSESLREAAAILSERSRAGTVATAAEEADLRDDNLRKNGSTSAGPAEPEADS